MKTRKDLDHFTGCLLGGAIGDALGAEIEFLSLTQIHQRFGESGVTDYKEEIGKFTDDTQMTLFTAEGVLRAIARYNDHGLCHPPSMMHHAYLRWLSTQVEESSFEHFQNALDGWLITIPELHARCAPGNTCLSALKGARMGSIREPINDSKGCGGVMRVAPVGLAVAKNRAFEIACEAAAITHGHPSGYLSAGFLALVIANIIDDISLEKSIEDAIRELKRWKGHEECLARVEFALSQSEASAEVIESIGAGWIAEEALAISFYCAVIGQHDFAKGVLLAVNHSGDSDSTDAITGNILGALLGKSEILAGWIDRLQLHSLIEEIAADIFAMTQGADISADKYPGW